MGYVARSYVQATGENSKMEHLPADEERVPVTSQVEVSEAQSGSRAWLLGAYTFLILWGTTFLALYFTDRLPL